MHVKVISLFFLGLSVTFSHGQTLKETVSLVLDTNPSLQNRLHNFHTKNAEIGIDKAGYYPTVNLESAIGRKSTGRISSDAVHESYDIFQHSLRLRQNIFNGFSTQEKVNYRKMQALSAAHNYLDTANDVAYQAINAYLSLQKEKALLKNAKQNVQRNTKTYNKIKRSHESGLTSYSEVSKIYSTLSLAKSNLMLQTNKLMNAQSNFQRVVGKHVDAQNLKKVNFTVKLPKNQKKAAQYAINYNPSIIAGTYNLRGAEALYRETKSTFYPNVNLELSQNYNDNYNEFIGKDDRAQALVVLSYNLFNGGADEAKKVSALSKVNEEAMMINDIKRQVVEKVDLSWYAYRFTMKQMPFLKKYKQQSQETLNLYHEEYEMGNRSLLDLISIENDLKRANDELITAKYDLLLAKYSILHAMGLTVASVVGTQGKYYKRVGIKPLKKQSPSVKMYKAKEHVSKPVAQQQIQTPSAKEVKQIESKEESSSFLDTFTKIRWESR